MRADRRTSHIVEKVGSYGYSIALRIRNAVSFGGSRLGTSSNSGIAFPVSLPNTNARGFLADQRFGIFPLLDKSTCNPDGFE